MKMTNGARARLSLRIPAKIDEALKQEAKLHCRSQNSLINEILQIYVTERIQNLRIDDEKM